HGEKTPYRPRGSSVIPEGMAKKALPVFIRDQRTGSMKEHLPAEPDDLALARDEARHLQFLVLVADDVEADRLLTIWNLGRAWPMEREMMVECAADGEEALE